MFLKPVETESLIKQTHYIRMMCEQMLIENFQSEEGRPYKFTKDDTDEVEEFYFETTAPNEISVMNYLRQFFLNMYSVAGLIANVIQVLIKSHLNQVNFVEEFSYEKYITKFGPGKVIGILFSYDGKILLRNYFVHSKKLGKPADDYFQLTTGTKINKFLDQNCIFESMIFKANSQVDINPLLMVYFNGDMHY